MSLSLESTYDDRALTRYLLGQLAGEEADRLDELAIVDDDMAWRVRTVENDLVDAYVRGTLDAESRQHFETHYLASPKRRAKVRFATRFARAVDTLGSPETNLERRRGVFTPVAAPAQQREPDKGGWLDRLGLLDRLDRLVPRSAAGWGFAYGAAALLLAITCGLLVMRDLRLGRALNDSEQQRAALDRHARELEDQLAEQRAAAVAAQVQGALDQERAASKAPPPSSGPSLGRASGPSSERSSSSPPESTGSPVATMALVLWPQTRGGGGTGPAAGAGASAATPAVAVPPGVDRVTLELQLETPDFVRYSVTLKESATNQIIWHADRLTAPAPGEPPTVSVAVPANLLTPQAYVLELTGYGATGGGDVIGAYAFQVARR